MSHGGLNLSAEHRSFARVNDPSSPPSALGLEAASWTRREDGSVEVRVTGRWLRRRPLGGGQPLLVIEREGLRHRFPAMPEPPSLTGAAPGTWQLSFIVSAALAPGERDRAWLQFGAMTIPLPISASPAEPAKSAAARPTAEEEELLVERRLRSAELALSSTREEAERAERSAHELRERTAQLERELELARRGLGERDRAWRAAEQRAQAETARRAELQDELARAERGEALQRAEERLHDARERLLAYEEEHERLARALDGAEHAAAAAQADRRRALEAARQAVERSRWAALAREDELATRRRAPIEAGPGPRSAVGMAGDAPPARAVADVRALAAERLVVAGRQGRGPDPSVVDASESPRVERVLGELRTELEVLRGFAERERVARIEAEERVAVLQARLRDSEGRVRASEARAAEAWERIEELRRALVVMVWEPAPAEPAPAEPAPPELAAPEPAPAEPAPPQPPAREPAQPEPASPEPPAGLDPSRLEAARTRLRAAEATLPEPVRSAAPMAPWLRRAFNVMAQRDPVQAGRLALALLPLHRLTVSEPLSYVLRLAGSEPIRVDVPGAKAPVTVGLLADPARSEDSPPPAFTVEGELAALGRTVAANSVRRRLRGGRARIRGRRTAATALTGLPDARIDLAGVIREGVSLEPSLAADLVAAMIDPSWTRGERFQVAFAEPTDAATVTVIEVRDGGLLAAVQGVEPPPGATVVLCSPQSIAAVAAGGWPQDVDLRGPARNLELLQRWVQRAQSG